MRFAAFARCTPAAVLALTGCFAHHPDARSDSPPASAKPSMVRSPAPPHASPRGGVVVVRGVTRVVLPAPARIDPRPYILSVSISPSVVGSGTTVSARVRTTLGVASVIAYAAGAALDVPRVSAGSFAGSTRLPELPAFVHGVYPVTFVARDGHGRVTQTAVSVTVP